MNKKESLLRKANPRPPRPQFVTTKTSLNAYERKQIHMDLLRLLLRLCRSERLEKSQVIGVEGMVARPGIEPGTQGFSVLCSTN